MKDAAHKKLVQKYYSERAKDYDRQKIRTWKSKHGFGTEAIDGILDALKGLDNKAVLEVGVGSGRIGSALLEKVPLWFVGVDLSKEMLELAKAKMSSYKQKFDLILGDAEHLPFMNGSFDAVVCISTMHYLADSETSLIEFSRILKEKGTFVYGDLTIHESDHNNFLDVLERMLSRVHTRYYKSSEMEKLLENHGFHILKVKIFPYRKSFLALMEDKGRYFDVKFEALSECIGKTPGNSKKLYSLDSDGLTLLYTLITALKENKY